MTSFQEKMLAIDRGNQESARIILTAPERDPWIAGGSMGEINCRTLSGKPRSLLQLTERDAMDTHAKIEIDTFNEFMIGAQHPPQHGAIATVVSSTENHSLMLT